MISLLLFLISIHAPTRGATREAKPPIPISFNFNPRSYKRSDKSNYVFIKCSNNFNPRSYKRSDILLYNLYVQCQISIHAPTRGATSRTSGVLSTIFISIHAPTRGATCQPYTPSHSCLISIHAPTRGATKRMDDNLRNAQFQSTLLQEERRINCPCENPHFVISIHAPTRGATAKMHNYPYTYL